MGHCNLCNLSFDIASWFQRQAQPCASYYDMHIAFIEHTAADAAALLAIAWLKSAPSLRCADVLQY